MIFWLVLLATIASSVWAFHSDLASLDCLSVLDAISVVGMVIGNIATVAMVCAILINHIGINGYVSSCNTRYNILVYQYENNFYDNDNDVGKYQLMQDIRKWNENLSRYRALQKDFWVGIFYPNIYDQFELIELEANE